MTIKERVKTALALVFLTGLTTLGGYYFFYQGIKGFYNYVRSARFVATEATVVHSGLKDTHFMFKGDRFHRVYLDIHYRYTVNGKTYMGRVAETYKRMWPFLEARRFVAKYPPGSKVKIIYNPKDPSDSFIIRKFYVETVILPLVFLVFLAVIGTALWVIL